MTVVMLPMDKQDVRDRILVAVTALRTHDSYLLEVDANERSITHRLAVHLEPCFPGWHVDCEFNRNGLHPKRLEEFAHDYRALADVDDAAVMDTQGRTVYPDIIVHHRGTAENLLVIEVKKTGSSVSPDADHAKLSLYREDPALRYTFAAALVLGIGENGERYDSLQLIDGGSD